VFASVAYSNGWPYRHAFVCEGVGVHGPAAATPDRALAAYVHRLGGSDTDWKPVQRATITPDAASGVAQFRTVSFGPRHAAMLLGFARITVSDRVKPWSADGACL